jgi:anti-anti-sigma factor
MAKEQRISTRLVGDVSIIDIGGDVTATTGQPIEDAYQRVSGDGARKILLVFAPDCYINSGGIAILIGILAASKKQAQTVCMTGLTPHFQKIFSMVGLTKYAQIQPSEAAALANFA